MFTAQNRMQLYSVGTYVNLCRNMTPEILLASFLRKFPEHVSWALSATLYTILLITKYGLSISSNNGMSKMSAQLDQMLHNFKCTKDQELMDIAAYVPGTCCMCTQYSPDGSTFLHEITSRLPSWNCDIE